MGILIRKTCRRRNVPGHTHLLTFCCFHGQSFLSRDRSRLWLIDALARARVLHHFDLWAWVIMPEHVHLLVRPHRQDYSISAVLTSVKKPVANAAIRYLRRHNPAGLVHLHDRGPHGRIICRFWQRGGGCDTNLWTPARIWEAIRYIHLNPVRRGLAARPEEWPWSSASAYAGHPWAVLSLDLASLPRQAVDGTR